MAALLPTVLAVLGLWCLVALFIEAMARRASRLGRLAPPPCFQAAPATEGSARLAFLGDVQRGIADIARPLAEALEAEKADLLVSSGDFVAHGEAPYYGVVLDAFARAGIDTPTRVVPGNHDLFPRRWRDPAGGYALFERAFGPPHWLSRVGPVLIAGIDDAVREVTATDLAPLRQALDAHAPGPWIAVCHRPPRLFERAGDPVEEDLVDLVALLEERPPLFVVCGHLHERFERVVGGVRYVVNAHGGDVHGLGLGRGPFELLRVDVAPDGATDERFTSHPRAPWFRVYWNQLAVRCWWARRKGLGRFLAAPAARLLSGLGLRAPLQRPGDTERPR